MAVTAAIPSEGFRIATGFLEVLARVEKAEREVDDLNRRVERKLDRAGESGGRSFGDGFLRGLRVQLVKLPNLLGKLVQNTAKLAALGVAAGAVTSAITGLASAVASLLPALAELAQVAAAAAGSLLLIPGAIAALGVAFVTAKLGFKDFGRALKALGTGDAKKLNEALAKLAPNAQRVVKTMQALTPAFTKMRLGIQQTLFAKLAEQVKALGLSWLPLLTVGLGGMAVVLNGTIRDAIGFLLDAATRLDFARIFAASSTTVHNLAAALRPLLRILTDVTVVGATLLVQLTGGLGPAVTAFAARVSAMRASGDLAGMITDGLAALGQFKDLAVDLFGIIRGIFGAADKANGGSGGIFGFFDRINKLINRPDIQKVLTSLFSSLGEAGAALIPVLATILHALVPVLQGMARITEVFGPHLQGFFEQLGRALLELEPAITAVAPLIDALGLALTPIAKIIAGLLVAAAPGLIMFVQELAKAIEPLVAVAPEVGKAIGDVLSAPSPLLAPISKFLVILLRALVGVVDVLGPSLQVVAFEFAALLTKLADALGPVIRELLPKFIDLGMELAAAIGDEILQNLPTLNALFGRFITLVAQLAAEFGDELIRVIEQLIPALPALTGGFIAFMQAVNDLLQAAQPFIPLFAQLLASPLGLYALGGFLVILAGLIELVATEMRMWTDVLRWIKGLFDDTTGSVDRAGHHIVEQVGKAGAAMQGLGANITAALGNFGTMLYDAGRNLIQGLINGIKSMTRPLTDQMGRVAGLVRDFWPFSPARRGPLSGSGDPRIAGRKTIERYAEGADAGLGALGAQIGAGMAAMANRFAPSPAAAGGFNGTVAVTPVIHLSADFGDGVRQTVRAVVVGEPQMIAAATDEGHRQRSWVDSTRKRIGTRQ